MLFGEASAALRSIQSVSTDVVNPLRSAIEKPLSGVLRGELNTISVDGRCMATTSSSDPQVIFRNPSFNHTGFMVEPPEDVLIPPRLVRSRGSDVV